MIVFVVDLPHSLNSDWLFAFVALFLQKAFNVCELMQLVLDVLSARKYIFFAFLAFTNHGLR